MITTHVLNTGIGRPASGMEVVLEMRRGADWVRISSGRTDDHGRLALIKSGTTDLGVYRLTFDINDYYRAHRPAPFFPEIQVIFRAGSEGEDVHLPLLVSPFGYSTYRGTAK
jgi:5-hydroxyisourate hydrolase